MTWMRVDDHLHSHRKTMRAGVPAMGLWVLAGSWASAEESDGWVPAYVLPRLVGGDQAEPLATLLVLAGLWHEDVVDGEAGYRFHQWAEHQPTREQLEARREAQRERMRRARAQGGNVRKNSARSEDEVTPTRPDPTRPTTDTPSRKRDAKPASEQAGDDFARFWELYPHKVGKQAAAKAWTKALQHAEVPAVAAGLRNALDVWTAEGRVREGRVVGRDHFVPHPSTWLSEGRWEDEQTALPAEVPTVRPPTARQCDGTDCPGNRHEWADSRNRFICMGV